MEYIDRKITPKILEAAQHFPVLVITGPRQTGKTTLAKHLYSHYTYYNLEDPLTRDIVENNPRDFIMASSNGMIIDEIQRIPQLFSYIQVCVDQNPERKFIITGSSDFALMEKITQSLAGRAALFTLLPFSFRELEKYVHECDTDNLIYKGFYPGVIAKGIEPVMFYSNYYNTYVERDARQITAIENLDLFRLFIKILAGRIGTEFNANSLSAEIGVSAPTIRKWLGILKTSYIVFTLTPYFANIEKRLTKTPKVYFYDTGLACNLLGIFEPSHLSNHPLRGPLFENLAIVEFLKEKSNLLLNTDFFFYRENSAREVDLLKCSGLDMDIYEIKSSGTYNKSFSKNLDYLKKLFGVRIKRSMVIYDGPSLQPLLINIRDI